MAGRVFVNYRLDDDPAAAARVRDDLARVFGHAEVFMDVNNLLAGQRFEEELEKELASCEVFIAVIGSRWTELLQARAASGEKDYVRHEIAGALERKIVVIPVRVGREGNLPKLPRADELPSDIRDLVKYQKQDVTHEHFKRDIGELVDAIKLACSGRLQPAAPDVPWRWIAASIVGTIALGYGAAYYAGAPVPRLWPGTTEPPARVQPKTTAELPTPTVIASPKSPVDKPQATRVPSAAAPKAEPQVDAKTPPPRTSGAELYVWRAEPSARRIVFKRPSATYVEPRPDARYLEQTEKDDVHIVAANSTIEVGWEGGKKSWYRYVRDIGSPSTRYVPADDVDLR